METTIKNKKSLNTLVIAGIIVFVVINLMTVEVYSAGVTGKLWNSRSTSIIFIGTRNNGVPMVSQLSSEDTGHTKAIFNVLSSGTTGVTVVQNEGTKGYEETRVANSIYIGNNESELARNKATKIFMALYSGE